MRLNSMIEQFFPELGSTRKSRSPGLYPNGLETNRSSVGAAMFAERGTLPAAWGCEPYSTLIWSGAVVAAPEVMNTGASFMVTPAAGKFGVARWLSYPTI